MMCWPWSVPPPGCERISMPTPIRRRKTPWGSVGSLGKSPKNGVELRCNYRFQSEWGHGPSEYMRKHDIYSDYRGERGVTWTGNGSKIQGFYHILSRFGCENKGIRWTMIFLFFAYTYEFSSKLHPLIHIWKGCPSLAVAEIGSRGDCTFFILFLFMDSYGVIVTFSSFFLLYLTGNWKMRVG